MRWLRQHLHPARAIALVGGPFDGEHFLAADPPPRALQLTLGGDGRYELRTIAHGLRSEAAYVLESAAEPAATCPACGKRGDVYAAQSQAEPRHMALHCLECGHLRAALAACA